MEQLGKLATEQRNPRSHGIDSVSTREMLGIINKEDAGVAEAVAGVLDSLAPFLDLLVSRVRNGGRLFYIGAGTSGRLGVLDAAECPPTFGVSPELVQGIIAGGESALSRATEATEDDPAMGARDLFARGFRGIDSLVGIAASGRTPYVLGAIRAARSAGALTAALVCTAQSTLAAEADHELLIQTGAEILTGSTRMKAGTGTKMVLNLISTGLMIRLGYTYGNLMVNVQPRNAKLADRALRIVAEATSCTREEAAVLFERAGLNVKTAIAMQRRGIPRAEAEELLAKANGVLAEVLNG